MERRNVWDRMDSNVQTRFVGTSSLFIFTSFVLQMFTKIIHFPNFVRHFLKIRKITCIQNFISFKRHEMWWWRMLLFWCNGINNLIWCEVEGTWSKKTTYRWKEVSLPKGSHRRDFTGIPMRFNWVVYLTCPETASKLSSRENVTSQEGIFVTPLKNLVREDTFIGTGRKHFTLTKNPCPGTLFPKS